MSVLQQSQTITLEAFEANLRGTSILWYLAPHSKPQYPLGFVDQVVTDAPPFAKKILIISQQTPTGWRLVDDWDVVFRPTTGAEWSLVLTYFNNCPKPVLAVLAPSCFVPAALLQKLNNTVTFVAFAYMEDISPNLHMGTYQSILLPPLSLDIIPSISFSQLLGIPSPQWNAASVLRDLHGAGASLVVSSIGDRLAQKQYYWYYTSKNQSSCWNLLQVQNILAALA
jgi:hypothetical protein